MVVVVERGVFREEKSEKNGLRFASDSPKKALIDFILWRTLFSLTTIHKYTHNEERTKFHSIPEKVHAV